MKGAILNKRNLVIIFIISIAIIYILLPKNNSFNSPSESCDAKFTKTFKFIEVVKEEHIKDIGLFTAKSLNDDFFEGLIDFFDNFLSDAYRAGFQCNERRCEFSEIWEPEGAKYNVKASPKEGDDCTGSKEIDVTGKGTSTWSSGAQANAILNLKAKLKKASEGVCKSPCTAKLTGVGDVGYPIKNDGWFSGWTSEKSFKGKVECKSNKNKELLIEVTKKVTYLCEDPVEEEEEEEDRKEEKNDFLAKIAGAELN